MKPLIRYHTDPPKIDPTLQSYKDFLDYLYMLGSESMSEQDLNELYGTQVTIQHRDKTLNIPFDAILYNKLVDLIETIIKEY